MKTKKDLNTQNESVFLIRKDLMDDPTWQEHGADFIEALMQFYAANDKFKQIKEDNQKPKTED